MIPLDPRCRDILLILLQSDKPLAATEIATRLGITPRMVRYSLRRVEAWLDEKGASLECRSNYGVVVDCSSLERTRLISELGHWADDGVLLPTERLHVVVLELLTAQEPVLVKQLSHQMAISRPTMLRDLQEAEIWLKEHSLSVISRPHFGFQVLGRERDQREAIVSLLLTSSGKKLFAALCTGPGIPLSPRLPGESVPFRKFYDEMDIPFSKDLFDSVATKLRLHVPDSAYVSLILRLSIMIARTRQGCFVEFSSERLEGFSIEKELQAARMIADQIHYRYNVTLPESEVAFIAAQLLAARNTRVSIESNSVQDAETFDPETREIVEKIVTEASTFLHPSLKVDQELIDALVQHLKPVFIQLLFDLPIRNPLLENIKRQYPYIFQVAKKNSAILQAKTGLVIPEEEIGYITLHLGAAMERLRRQPKDKKKILVVCGEGVATAQLLASRIRAELPNIDIVQVLSLQELRRYKISKNAIDAILATIPLNIDDVPVIIVNPFLRAEDISRLNEALELAGTAAIKETTPLNPDENDSLSDLITAATIRLQVNARSWMEVVDKAGASLINAKAIEPAYVEAMKQTLVKHGPYAVTWPGVVLLHARPEDGVRRLCMSLTTLRTPVYFGHPENDPVDIALVIGAVDPYSHLRALKELAELLADESAMTMIRQSSDRQEVREIICRFTAR